MAELIIGHGKKKDNTRKKGVAAQWKADKRKEAEARQAVYDKLSLDQKIAKAVPGSKEYVKLMIKKTK